MAMMIAQSVTLLLDLNIDTHYPRARPLSSLAAIIVRVIVAGAGTYYTLISLPGIKTTGCRGEFVKESVYPDS